MSNRNGITLQWLAFWTVLLIGVSLAVSYILAALGVGSLICQIIERVGFAIAIIVVIALSYTEAFKTGRESGWKVIWVIAVIVIAVFYVLLYTIGAKK